MALLKKLNPLISPHLTHLYNDMIWTSIYPSQLKVSKILPILKPNKNQDNIEGYRPINILGPIDKIF